MHFFIFAKCMQTYTIRSKPNKRQSQLCNPFLRVFRDPSPFLKEFCPS